MPPAALEGIIPSMNGCDLPTRPPLQDANRRGLHPFATVSGVVWARPHRFARDGQGVRFADDFEEPLSGPLVAEEDLDARPDS